MPWKYNEEGEGANVKKTIAMSEEGLPVWIHESGENSGQESGIDHGATLRSIAELTREQAERRTTNKELADKLKAITDSGVDDIPGFVQKANEALEVVANLDAKKLMDAGEVEKVKKGIEEAYVQKIADIQKSYETSLGEKDEMIAKVNAAIRTLVIKSSFGASEFIKTKTTLDSEIAYNTFGQFFDFEENAQGELSPFAKHYNTGEKIFSLRNPGSVAAPEEAIQILINEYPNKDSILQGTDASGGGGGGSDKNLSQDGKKLSEITNPAERLRVIRQSGATNQGG